MDGETGGGCCGEGDEAKWVNVEEFSFALFVKQKALLWLFAWLAARFACCCC